MVFALLSPVQANAQLLDSLRSSVKKKTRIDFRLDSRNTFITNRNTQVFGIKLGVSFGKQLKVGGGFNTLKDFRSSHIYFPSESNPAKLDTVDYVLKLDYLCYYIEYVFYKTRKWEISVPVQLGFGNTRHEYNYRSKLNVLNKKHILLYEPSMSCKYRFFPWIGVGAEIGYRVVLGNTRVTRRDLKFAAPTYGFSLLIYYSELYRSIFPK